VKSVDAALERVEIGYKNTITHHRLITKRLAKLVLEIKLAVESAIALAIKSRAQLILQLIVCSTVCKFVVTQPVSCWALENHVLLCFKHAYTRIVVYTVKLAPK